MTFVKLTPPEPVFSDGRLQNFNDIRDWAMMNDPTWHHVERLAHHNGLTGINKLELLAVMLLRVTCEQRDAMYNHFTSHIAPPVSFSPTGDELPEVKP